MSLPKINVSPEPLYRMCYAGMKSNLLLAAIELKIFDYLSRPITFERVAETINTHPRNTMLFLNALAACDLVVKDNGLYENATIASAFLTEGTPTSLGAGFLNQKSMSGSMPDDLLGLVQDGPSSHSPESDSDSQEKWADNAVWMANHARSGIAQQMSRLVSRLPEFSGFERMLDLGGGPGIFGIAMVDKHPSMRGVIFDRKPVVAVAEKFIREHHLEMRVEVLSGDYNQDPIGDGYDFIWASSTLNFAQNNMERVMDKIFHALNPGGIFINLSEGLTNEGTKPVFFVLCTLLWAMSNPMTAFDQGVIADAMCNAGFKTVKSRTLHTCWGQMDLDIARK